jgi:plastocyanin
MGKVSRKLLALSVAGAIAGVLTWLPAGGASSPVRDAATRVKVGNNFLSPTSKTIGRGGTVAWVWSGGRRHNLLGRSSRGRVIFRSRTSSRRGFTFRHRFAGRGRFSVICTLHPSSMRMTVRVR